MAGALWALASNKENQATIAKAGGVVPFVELLRNGSLGAQETTAGALSALAETPENRVSIAADGGIALLVALFDGGSLEAISEAAGALQTLVVQNVPNQQSIAAEAVAMLKNGSTQAQEHVTQLLRNLAQDPENRSAIAKAGAVPELVRQLECGSEKAMGMAASGLALIALKSEKDRATVTNELVKLLSSNKEAVRQRAAEALTDMAADESSNLKSRHTASTNGVPLVNLLKDGLKDGRVEAQEYALRSLLSIADAAAKEQIVSRLHAAIACLAGGRLSAMAGARGGGHRPSRLARCARSARRRASSRSCCSSTGTTDAKGHAASTLAPARRADASSQIAEAGAVSAFVRCSPADARPGGRARLEIALDNPDTQAQIAEERDLAARRHARRVEASRRRRRRRPGAPPRWAPRRWRRVARAGGAGAPPRAGVPRQERRMSRRARLPRAAVGRRRDERRRRQETLARSVGVARGHPTAGVAGAGGRAGAGRPRRRPPAPLRCGRRDHGGRGRRGRRARGAGGAAAAGAAGGAAGDPRRASPPPPLRRGPRRCRRRPQRRLVRAAARRAGGGYTADDP